MNNLEDFMICPITGQIYKDPVKAEDGYTYENKFIKQWFEGHNTSPMTSKIISNKLTTDCNMKSLVEQYLMILPNQRVNQYGYTVDYHLTKDVVINAFLTKQYNVLMDYRDIDILDNVTPDISIMESIAKIPFDIFVHVMKHTFIAQNKLTNLKTMVDFNGMGLIHYVALYGTTQMMNYLHDQNFNIEYFSKYEKLAPLHYACQRIGDQQMAGYLINELNVNKHTIGGSSLNDSTDPLYHAIVNKNTNIINMLWDSRLLCKKKYTYTESKPIHLMSQHIPGYVIDLIFKNENDEVIRCRNLHDNLLSRDAKNNNIMHYAFANNEMEDIIRWLDMIVDTLFNKTINSLLYQHGSMNKTPVRLLIDRYYNDADLMLRLINNNVNFFNDSAEDIDLFKLIRCTKNQTVINALIQSISMNKSMSTISGYHGYVAIHYLIKYHDMITIKLYFDSVGFENILTQNHDNLLIYTIRNRPEFLDCMIGFFKDTTESNNQSVQAIHEAVIHKINVDTVKNIVTRGADINTKTRYGKSPLHLAIEYQDADKIIQFIQTFINIIDTSVKDDHQMSYQDHVRRNKHKFDHAQEQEIMKYLVYGQ